MYTLPQCGASPLERQFDSHTVYFINILMEFVVALSSYQGAQLIIHCGIVLHGTTSTSPIPQALRARSVAHVVVAAEVKALIRVQLALIGFVIFS